MLSSDLYTLIRVSVLEPRPDPETVAAIHDIVWRVASVENERTQGLDRKAAALATFASLLTSLTATLGLRFVDMYATWWALGLFVSALVFLALSVWKAVEALLPEEYRSLGSAYLERLPTWAVVRSRPEDVHGEAIEGVVASIARERKTNDTKADRMRLAFSFLLVGLGLIVIEAATLAAGQVV